jgi:hypothetical protein
VLRGAIFLRSPSNENLEAARTRTGRDSNQNLTMRGVLEIFPEQHNLFGNHSPSRQNFVHCHFPKALHKLAVIELSKNFLSWSSLSLNIEPCHTININMQIKFLRVRGTEKD